MPRRAELSARTPVAIALPRLEAAAACGCSPSYFDRLVEAQILPPGRRLALPGTAGKTVWLLEELRAALADLPTDGEEVDIGRGAKAL